MRYCWLIVTILMAACHEQNKNKISPAELVKSREIKKVSEAEILQGGTTLAVEIMKGIEAITDSNMNREKPNCETNDWPELDSLATNYSIRIRLAGKGSPKNEELEGQLLEAYQYNVDNGLALNPSVQRLDPKTVLYVHPIEDADVKFENCSDSTMRKGPVMWSLKIPVKNIVEKL